MSGQNIFAVGSPHGGVPREAGGGVLVVGPITGLCGVDPVGKV